jgi:small subunit ribosomal protein S3
MKQSITNTMRMGAEGIKIVCSGRLAGAEMARKDEYKEGRIPLHTIRAEIDYAIVEAQTVYGKIGIKVWICKGEVFGARDLSPNQGASNAVNTSGESTSRGGNNDRGGRGGNDRRGGGGGGRGGNNDRGGRTDAGAGRGPSNNNRNGGNSNNRSGGNKR